MEKLIDLAAMGKELGVPEVASYAPNGMGPFYNQVWSKDYVLRMLDMIEPEQGDVKYILTGHVDPWISMAVWKKLGSDNVWFRVPAGDTKLTVMQRGQCRYPDVVECRTEGERAYVTFDFDKLEKIVGGPQKVDMDELALPELPEGMDVYFHGIGKFPFQMRCAYTLAQTCRSLSCASGGAGAYSCAIPGGGLKEVGDETPIA